MADEDEEVIELQKGMEKPRKKMSEKQLENLAKGRAARTKKVEVAAEDKESKRLEARFDKLVAMFEQVRMPTPEVQAKVKAKRAPPPPEDSSESDDEPPPPPRVPKIEQSRPVAVAVAPSRQVMFSFR